MNLPAEHEDEYRLHRRFDRLGRLVGDEAMRALFDAHVVVFGLGGVGSWAAESLARSGVGRLTLVDFDKVCVTNSNRQLPALRSTVGRPKAEVLAERLREVNPQARIEGVPRFYSEATSEELLAGEPDFVLDAIDNFTAKCHLLSTCLDRGLPVVTSTGAAGRMDPTMVRVTDLARTKIDPMALRVRKILREKYGFGRKKKFGLPAVYSEEPPTVPVDLRYDRGAGQNDQHSCEKRTRIYGTASFVTGAFGLALASVAVRGIAERAWAGRPPAEADPELEPEG